MLVILSSPEVARLNKAIGGESGRIASSISIETVHPRIAREIFELLGHQPALRPVAKIDTPRDILLFEPLVERRLAVDMEARIKPLGHVDMTKRSAAVDEKTIGPSRTRHR